MIEGHLLLWAVVFGLGLVAGGIIHMLLDARQGERHRWRREFILKIGSRVRDRAETHPFPTLIDPDFGRVPVERRRNGPRSTVPYTGGPPDGADIFARGAAVRASVHSEAQEVDIRMSHG